MSNSWRQTDRGRRWMCALCISCLLCLLGVGGVAGRAWRFERRGVERLVQGNVERRPGINVDLAQYAAPERAAGVSTAGVSTAGALDAALSDLASLDLHWLRQRFPWQSIEPAPGVYRWEPWDALVAAVDRHGLGLIAVLDAPPEWALARDRYPLPCAPPCRVDAYARFVAAFAARYGGVVDHYQVWDEPNLSRSWGGGHVHPCGYLALLKAAYPAIHAADPTAWVLGGGLAPTQAPGPDNLNDLAYLRHLYALGGGSYFDLLAVKLYGFWSGPEDRRVGLGVLNASRVVAQRELMRAWGDGDKPVWAVEWGWAVLPPDGAGDAPPWGSDTISVQAPRIREAVARARAEWPWMGVMCWAEYQPDLPEDDLRWGFALRDGLGAATALYPVLRETAAASFRMADRSVGSVLWPILIPLYAVAALVTTVLWKRCACAGCARRLWRRWDALPWPYHAAVLLALGGLYALTPHPGWIALELILAALVLYGHPRWALLGAVFCIPLIYLARRFEIGGLVLDLTPAEILLWLAVGVSVVRYTLAPGAPGVRALGLWFSRLRERWRALDLLWAAWVALGALSPLIAPDPALAWREWRLTMLGPLALYVLLRSSARDGGNRGHVDVLFAWLASGVVVALVGVGQWIAGAIVRAGDVGRVTGVYYSPNHLALYLERIWPLALALALYGGLARRWRWAAWGGVVLLGLALYLTYSRAAWLLAMPAALLAIGLSYRRQLRPWAAGVLALVVVLAAASVYQGRLTARAAPQAVLLSEVRLPVWQSALDMIADHPWMGVGLDGFQFIYPAYMRAEAWTEPLLYHPHNMWLDAAVRLGVPGLVVFCLLVVSVMRELGRASGAFRLPGDWGLWQRAAIVGCLAGLWAGLAHGLVDSGYFVIDLAWCLALVAGLPARSRGDPRAS